MHITGKTVKFIPFLLITTLMFLSAGTTGSAEESAVKSKADQIEVFVRDGCPHCASAKVYLQTLKTRQPQLNIVIQNVEQQPSALERLGEIAKNLHINTARVPAFYVGGQLIIGFTDDTTTGLLIETALKQQTVKQTPQTTAGSCSAKAESLSCSPDAGSPVPEPEQFALNFLGYTLSLDAVGLPVFTVAMGLLDGFNPCSLWVLLLMISVLAPMKDRVRMLAVAGTFVAVEGIAYFVFMAAWLNLFLLIGLSEISQVIIALIALMAGIINVKDFFFFGRGFSLSISDKAKPDIYARIRRILLAENLFGAVIAAAVLAILVQIVEFMCTSGFPALFTRIITLKQMNTLDYYAYLLLYNLAYMFDDLIILAIGVITLSHKRLQEKEGRWLKLISGLVMIGLAVYLLVV
jgi:glutaredoxin